MAGERNLPGLGLTAFFNLGSNGWKESYDANWRILSALVQLTAISRVTALPATPAEGDIYIVPSSAAEHANEIALFDNALWVYVVPKEGFVATVADENCLIWFSGVSWTLIPTGVSQPYDLGCSYVGSPSDGLVILRFPVPRAVSFPINMVGSYGVSNAAAAASSVFSLRKNGTQFATMTFATGASVATFSAGSATLFSAGDIFTVMCPATADLTLADLGMSFAGTRV